MVASLQGKIMDAIKGTANSQPLHAEQQLELNPLKLK
jgi:hypothetical protein